ncbi:hypothetical protein BD626DRAFT_514193 [Schizophyllum amplum]|uniref:Uncharacterized protein n=1 Tax=Schizophyllum amplum TaxID=97359 RepID=A0A550BYP1_9AGAR|nr:hypothetical protein BD626DRAFT_514193 [Auriculariopsis ampla]
MRSPMLPHACIRQVIDPSEATAERTMILSSSVGLSDPVQHEFERRLCPLSIHLKRTGTLSDSSTAEHAY